MTVTYEGRCGELRVQMSHIAQVWDMDITALWRFHTGRLEPASMRGLPTSVFVIITIAIISECLVAV